MSQQSHAAVLINSELAPMKHIVTALLSYGVSGKIFHAPFLQQHPGFRLKGAWERSRELIQNDYPEAQSYPSLEAVLHDGEVELVVVNTPVYTHFEYAKIALLAGKHVLVEKTFTVTSDEARELGALAEAKGKVLAVYQNRRWDNDFLLVEKLINSDRLGFVHSAEFSFQRYKPVPGPKAHVEQPGPGAGLLYDLGPHLIDQALHLFGMPQSLTAQLRILRPESQVVDDFLLHLHYDTGLRTTLLGSLLVTQPQPAFVLHGSTGSFTLNRCDAQETELRSGMLPGDPAWNQPPATAAGRLTTVNDGVVQEENPMPGSSSYLDFYTALGEAIRKGAKSPVSAGESLRTVQLIEAAVQSSEEGRRIHLL